MMGRRPRLRWLCGALLALGAAACRGTPASPPALVADVTAVSGRSWLTTAGLSIETDSLGKMGGADAALDTERRESMPRLPWAVSRFGRFVGRFYTMSPVVVANAPFAVAGADLYRLNCQACHGPDGLGHPPEINSVLGPVQGTSATLLAQRLREKGRPVDDAFVKELAAGARDDLRQRLAEGGEKMPSFKHLRDDEQAALMHHLERLAAVPGEDTARTMVTQPVVRIGEHVVKGTCHICHDAVGPRPSRMAVMMGGAIPPIASFTLDYSADEVVSKVRSGTSGMMMHASSMPRFPYLTPEEIVSAVAYLAAYPPQP